MTNVLVTGGAGYIGSHAWEQAVKFGPFEQGDLQDRAAPIVEGARHPGDCTKLVSGSADARDQLGWDPKRSTMEAMVTDAWRWHQNGHYDR